MLRNLNWEGCVNVRDLGGLSSAYGRQTRWGAFVRADNINQLTENGWQALKEHGVKTVIDLRGDFEQLSDPEVSEMSSEIRKIKLPLEDLNDVEFWQRWLEYNCTALYFHAFLDRYPDKIASIFSVMAQSQPGCVLFHCASGRDRTGLITIMLLALGSVVHDEIVFDYELSEERLRRLNRFTEQIKISELLKREQTTHKSIILSLLKSFDAHEYLARGGLSNSEIAIVQNRLFDAL